MWWLSALGTLLLATALTGLPVTPNPDAELVPEVVENATLSTELMPPPINAENKTRHGVVYLINLYAVTNSSDLEDGEERLTDEVVESMPGILEPVATVLLVVEADDEETPVSLDEIAKELEEEGFSIKKVEKDGETKVIKVDFGDVAEDELEDDLGVLVKPANSLTNKVRRKRAPCLKCKLGKLMGGGGYGGGGYGGGGYGGGGYGGGYGGGQPSYGGGGGGCGGGCGGGGGGHQGGGGTVGVIPVVVVPVQGGGGGGGHYPSGGGGGGHYPSGGGGGCGGGGCGGGGGGHYPSGGGGGGNYYPPSGGGGHAHPGGGQCDVCAGRGGGGGGGGGRGGSWSQSSAQASAQSSSGTW